MTTPFDCSFWSRLSSANWGRLVVNLVMPVAVASGPEQVTRFLNSPSMVSAVEVIVRMLPTSTWRTMNM
jgi:hypothetical protein